MEGVIYVNTGDFVESCSLVVEHYDGRIEVLRWKDPLQLAAWVDENARVRTRKRPRRRPNEAQAELA